MYKTGIVAAPNRVAQQENIALWLVKDGQSPWSWVIPDDVNVSSQGDVTFLQYDRTWVAIRPLGAEPLRVDAALTKQLVATKKNRFPGHKVLSSRGSGETFCCLAIEIGERESHGSLEQFKQAALSAQVDVSGLPQGIARYKSAAGKWLGIHGNDNPLDLGVWRNGNRRDLKHAALYQSPVISAQWGSGRAESNRRRSRLSLPSRCRGHR